MISEKYRERSMEEGLAMEKEEKKKKKKKR